MWTPLFAPSLITVPTPRTIKSSAVGSCLCIGGIYKQQGQQQAGQLLEFVKHLPVRRGRNNTHAPSQEPRRDAQAGNRHRCR